MGKSGVRAIKKIDPEYQDGKGAPVAGKRKVNRPLSPKQLAFIREYLVDMDRASAVVRAGYDVTAPETKEGRQNAFNIGSKLLKHAAILEAIDKEQLSRLERLQITGDQTVLRFNFIYLQALNKRDFKNALKALENIGRVLGIYKADNKQKANYTQADVDRLKDELTQAGFDFTRLHLRSGN